MQTKNQSLGYFGENCSHGQNILGKITFYLLLLKFEPHESNFKKIATFTNAKEGWKEPTDRHYSTIWAWITRIILCVVPFASKSQK